MLKIVFLYGVLGGLIDILIHLLSYKIYYLAGLLFPVSFSIIIWLSLRHMYKVINKFNFFNFYKISISVFVISCFINIIYVVLFCKLMGSLKNNIFAYLVLFIFGLILSLVVTFIFQLFLPPARRSL